MKKREIAIAALLIGVGCAQMVGDVLGITTLKGVAAASGASPAPKVFTSQGGFETYANRYYLDWQDRAGTKKTLELTPQIYSGMRGPYNRRNVYGAVFSYAPVLDANPLTRPMFRTVLRRSFCGKQPVTAEVGVPAEAASNGSLHIRLEPRRADYLQRFQLTNEVRCDG